jgi:hypothetical protein
VAAIKAEFAGFDAEQFRYRQSWQSFKKTAAVLQ